MTKTDIIIKVLGHFEIFCKKKKFEFFFENWVFYEKKIENFGPQEILDTLFFSACSYITTTKFEHDLP